MGAPTRILVVDDHALFRESLVRFLESEPDFYIVGQCDSAAGAMDLINANPVDLVLLDYDLGDHSGTDFLQHLKIRKSLLKVLVVTAGVNDAATVDILSAGAAGLLSKNSDLSRLVEAIRKVSKGEIWLESDAVRSLVAGASKRADQARRQEPLTTRQQQVLSGILAGLANKEIAWDLKISTTTVKATIRELFEKSRVRTRSQLVRMILEKKIAD